MGHASRFIASVAVATVLLPAAAYAADDTAALRAEIAALKAEYAERVTALEARIDQLESASTALPRPWLPSRHRRRRLRRLHGIRRPSIRPSR